MIITLIAAMDKNYLIGRNNALPWYLPADLAHFKAVTLGKPIIMGRRTFESLGKPLPYRRNIVITQQDNSTFEGCDIFHSLGDALDVLAQEREIMIIGGACIFREALSKATKMILTIIDYTFNGDTYFPKWNAEEWKIISKKINPSDEKNLYAFWFLKLERLNIA
ncbi:dihydrofolate reductase [Coxiella endosymbiont of Amblyomma nuttalli]|uniref:dihydrofolate reductase n=1 Tax=Coxiella endosymbiont of Amblyomma nuttalli TaxID=2749996 RepID=UPI001BA938A3|nr:dihydrofolate reductase [Coxiella endosymbiont of Amblyomma nuttalli]QTS83587.1 Dihydrofolate reductase type 3 [Coxiella endosymbiont of Amblyomma nuttalli]